MKNVTSGSSRLLYLFGMLVIALAFHASCTAKGGDGNDSALLLGLLANPAASGGQSGGQPTDSTCTPSLMGGTMIGCALSLSSAVTTYAGDTQGITDATGTAALFNAPSGMATDGTNLYVCDENVNTIRKIVIATGVVTTFAGTANAAGSTDATGTAARFTNPTGITTDGTNLYVADRNSNKIRKIVIATAAVTTLAGDGTANFLDHAVGTSAQFNNPAGITTDGTNVYVADSNNNRIRKIVIATGVVSTLAGSTAGHNDAAGTAAQFDDPKAITTDGTNLYVVDNDNVRIRKIVIAGAVVTTIAGKATFGNANGNGVDATFKDPLGITTDGTNLYITEAGNDMIRMLVLSSTNPVSTLAGSVGAPGNTDATGTAAQFNNPKGITTDGTNLYISGFSTFRIRKIE